MSQYCIDTPHELLKACFDIDFAKCLCSPGTDAQLLSLSLPSLSSKNFCLSLLIDFTKGIISKIVQVILVVCTALLSIIKA